jgi:PEGA domain
MRVLKISFLVLILVGAFTTSGFSAQHHNVTPMPAPRHHATVSPRAVPSGTLHDRQVGSTGKIVLPYPQGYNNGYHYYHYPYNYYPYRSFYNPYFYSSFAFYPYYSYGFWPWYYGFYSPSYYPYSGYGYGYGYRPYGGYGYGGYGYYGYGEVRVEVKPKTAKVFVDGDYVGVVDDYDGWWQRLKLEPGKHRIVVREAGFAPYVQTVRVLPGEDTHIKSLLQPGQDRISEEEMRLPPGERDRDYDRHDRYHRYDRDRHPYGEDHDHDRSYDNDRDDDNDYNDNEHSEMNHEMNHDGEMQPDRERDYAARNEEPRDQDTRNNKMFTVQVEPHDATIYIDGNYYGTADVNESGQVQALLPEGTHKVEVVRPGYESFSQNITVGNSDNKLVVQLHKK